MNRLSELFILYYNKTATAAEREEFMQLVQAASPAELANLIGESGERLADFDSGLSPERSATILAAILGKPAAEAVASSKPSSVVYRIGSRRSFWWAAAAILLLLGAGSYFVFFAEGDKKTVLSTDLLPKDVAAPDKTRATITLSDGTIIFLDSIGSGTIRKEHNVTVMKTGDARIVYSGNASEVLFNTLNNPRGSKVIDIILTDGSHVWLNAGSSITYPVAFHGDERQVKISGEAYFEVAHHSSIPFTVIKGEMAVQVLGTKFNINAYDDESDIKVTLLEGSVRVRKDIATSMLKPGQQARIKSGINVINNVDVGEVMAWKNGLFKFNKAGIQTVMKQLERWFDIEVNYKGSIPEFQFVGELSRELSLLTVLAILEKSGVRFRLENRVLTVL